MSEPRTLENEHLMITKQANHDGPLFALHETFTNAPLFHSAQSSWF